MNNNFKDKKIMATNNENDPIVGIDLGTTYSSIAIYDQSPRVILSEFGETIIPSYVVFENENICHVGEIAKWKSESPGMASIFDIKRLIGKQFSDEKVKEELELKKWPFVVFEDKETGKAKIRVKIKKVKNNIQEINTSSNIPLDPRSRDRNVPLNPTSIDLHNVNIINNNIPLNAYSNESNIATIEKEFFPEEISSMIIKKLKKYAEDDLGKKINRAIITVPARFNNSEREATKLAGEMAGFRIERILNEPTAAALAYGLNENNDDEKKILVFDLGGGTFDVSLLEIDFRDKRFEVISTDGDTHLGGKDFDFRLVEKCIEHFNKNNDEQLNLKDFPSVIINLLKECEKAKILLSEKESTTIKIDKLIFAKDFEIKFTRLQFENYCKDLFDKCFPCIEKVLNEGKISSNKLTDIILVGGSTKIPYIKNMLKKKYFNATIHDEINPNEAVAIGACIEGGILNQNSSLNNFTLFDITPMSLGMRIINDTFSVVIKKNTSIPNRKKKEFFTSVDNQTMCIIQIYEGESKNINDNYLLGSFYLTNLPKLPKGEAKVEVTFEIDANSILTVTAEDLSNTNNRNQITIINNKGIINKEEVERIKARINDLNDYSNINLVENRVLINDIKNFKKLIFVTSDKGKKYHIYKKLIKSFENYLDSLLNGRNENEASIEKFSIFTQLLINEYAAILSFDCIESYIIEEIKNNLYKYMKKILKYEKCSVFDMLKDLRINKEIYDFCALFRIVELFVQGKKMFDSFVNNTNLNEKEKRKKINTTYKIFNDLNNERNGIDNQLKFYFIEDDFDKKIKEYLKDSKIYLKKLKIKKIIFRANDYLKKAIDEKYNLISLKDLKSSYSDFNYAINLNKKEENNIVIIYDVKDYDYCNAQINKILILKNKNNTNYVQKLMKIQEILIEKEKIDNDNEYYLEECNETNEDKDKKLKEFKKEIEKKMKNLENNFEKTAKEIIQFILIEHPLPDNEQIDVETEFNKDRKKLLNKLRAKYHPDHNNNDSYENEILIHLNHIIDNLKI